MSDIVPRRSHQSQELLENLSILFIAFSISIDKMQNSQFTSFMWSQGIQQSKQSSGLSSVLFLFIFCVAEKISMHSEKALLK